MEKPEMKVGWVAECDFADYNEITTMLLATSLVPTPEYFPLRRVYLTDADAYDCFMEASNGK